jgi:hypothetical protein
MKIDIGNFCPLIKEDCIKTKCSWFTQIRGNNPNTGAEIDEWGCAIAWMPIMMIENSQQQRQTGAAVESFRNEMVKANEATTKVLLASVNRQNMIEIKNEIDDYS